MLLLFLDACGRKSGVSNVCIDNIQRKTVCYFQSNTYNQYMNDLKVAPTE